MHCHWAIGEGLSTTREVYQHAHDVTVTMVLGTVGIDFNVGTGSSPVSSVVPT